MYFATVLGDERVVDSVTAPISTVEKGGERMPGTDSYYSMNK